MMHSPNHTQLKPSYLRLLGRVVLTLAALVPALTVLLLTACGEASSESLEELRENLDYVFAQDRVATVQFQPVDGFDAMETAFLASGDKSYHQSGFQFEDKSTPSVGLRLKGTVLEGAGLAEEKYSLKINTNYFDAERFLLLDKLDFDNGSPDPSMMREVLASRLYRAMGVPAPRTAFARVSADGTDLGLYTMIQNVDKRLLREFYGQEEGADDGNLYRCVAPYCTLRWRGDAKINYFTTACDEEDGCGLVLKSNETDPALNDYADVIDLLDFLNNSSDEDFAAGVEAVLDVDQLLRTMAVGAAITDYEGLLGAYDDFYLYHRPDTGLWVFIPWDQNKSFGRSRCANDTVPTNPVQKPWCQNESRPLFDRIMAVPRFAAAYRAHLTTLLNDWFTPEKMQVWIDQYDALIQPELATDTAYAWTVADYELALGDGIAGAKAPGLATFIAARRTLLLDLLAAEDAGGEE